MTITRATSRRVAHSRRVRGAWEARGPLKAWGAATARTFYDEVVLGDIVKVVGSTDAVAPGNGYGDWNVGWDDWQAGSALT